MSAIVVEGLTKRYPGASTPALDGVSFEVPAGQVCGVLGSNGAGKSTTLKILAGILQPSGGQARVGGHDVVAAPLEAKRVLGYVPESGALYGLLSIDEHLALISDLHELDPETARERTARLLGLFGLEDLRERRIDTLSKGQRQKAVLACGLLPDPQVVLFDEPLNGLDAASARTLKEVIQGLAARGRTVLYCSHILDVVERLCERALILHEGAVVADAPTAELVERGHGTLEGVFHQLTRSKDVEGLAGSFLDGLAQA